MIFFTILGNHEDPKGNPIGYVRMTAGGKRFKPRALRYHAWQDYVWVSLLKCEEHPPYFEAGQKVFVDCYIEFKNDDDRHPDCGNVAKGIADALQDRVIGGILERRLYPNDKSVLERPMDFNYSENPGVLVIVHGG